MDVLPSGLQGTRHSIQKTCTGCVCYNEPGYRGEGEKILWIEALWHASTFSSARYETEGLPRGLLIVARLNVNFPRCKTGGLFLIRALSKSTASGGMAPCTPALLRSPLRQQTTANTSLLRGRSLRAYANWLRSLDFRLTRWTQGQPEPHVKVPKRRREPATCQIGDTRPRGSNRRHGSPGPSPF